MANCKFAFIYKLYKIKLQQEFTAIIYSLLLADIAYNLALWQQYILPCIKKKLQIYSNLGLSEALIILKYLC